MHYIDGLKTLSSDDPANALLLGTALHTGLEHGTERAVDEYLMAYPVITDEHIDEVMKLEHLIPLAKNLLSGGGQYETLISTPDFIGYMDYLITDDGVNYDLYDFKYSNNTAKYRQSAQLHIYKFFFELMNPGRKINHLFYLMVPKVKIRRGKREELGAFRDRIQAELNKVEPFLVPVEYDFSKVAGFLLAIKRVLEAGEFPKAKSYLCNYCEYQKYCEEGIDYMLLPKNERRNIEKVTKRVLWLYGAPFSGKTTFANKFDDPLMLNTDGNIKFVDAPYIPIRDDVKVEGRMTKRTLAWEVFKGAIDELEKKENDFKTIIVDLLEDLYEHCRLYMYQQMGITHESDDSFRAWDKVRVEFLSTLKRLMNLDYENIILISHVDTSKDITKKGGDKITAIKPNLQEKASNKVAGMVDIVARVVADGDVRTLSFKTNEVIFGGGRLTASTTEIPLDYDAFLKVYNDANKAAANAMYGKKITLSSMYGEMKDSTTNTEKPRTGRRTNANEEPAPESNAPTEAQDAPQGGDSNAPDAQGAITDDGDDGLLPGVEPNSGEVMDDATQTEPPAPAPKVRTRKRRGE